MSDSQSIADLDLVDTRTAARFLGMSQSTLHIWRREGKGPAFYRLGTKTIKYSLKDLTDFMERVQHVE